MARTVLRHSAWVAAVPLLVALFAAAGTRAQVPPVGATAQVRDAANRLVATADFREGRSEVLITILFPNPPVLSGTHAVHIHEVGRCDPPDFQTAGNIFNPFNKKHGRQNPQGAEAGDLPNINITTGLTSYNTSAPGGTLGSGPGSLLGPNGTALVIFSGEDDQMTDPDGKSGSRIACGVITASGAAGPPPASKVASPVPAARSAAGQPAQPAAKPSNSPVVVRPPVVANPAASPSPAQVVPALPTAVVAPTSPPVAASPPQSGNSIGGPTALFIAVLGVGLLSAGYLLRRRGQLP